MTIDIPELDDKTYDDLFQEASKRLPAYDDNWTDYNPADPGVTILELFAFLADTHMYQLDQVTDEHRQKYLQLMGETQRPPEPASMQLSLSLPDGEKWARLPEGTKLTVIDGSDVDKIFETTEDVDLIDASVEKVVTEHGDGMTDHTQANSKEGMFYRAFGEKAEPMNALYLGFDFDPFEHTDSLSITVDYHEENLPPVASHGDETPRFYPSVSTVWEYCVDYENSRHRDAWRRMRVIRDGTYGFYRNGRVTLAQPEEWGPEEWGRGEYGAIGQPPGPVWIRCRIIEGGYEVAPQFNSVRLNVVDATHRSTVENEELTRKDPKGNLASLTEQTYRFEHAPVLDADIEVDGERYEEVDDFDASGPTDRHYVLNRTDGTVQFGDGINGKMPEPSASVIARQYAFGGGPDGNVPASANWQFLHREKRINEEIRLGDIEITAEHAGTGGTEAESLEEAFQRTKRDLRRPYRAVTQEDYRYLATNTPGLRFGRATVLVEERTDLGTNDEPVEVTVVVVPYAPLNQPRPEPSQGFLDAVQRHIDKHRLLTDRVTVEGPDYIGLSFDIDVQTSVWIPESRAQGAIESALEEYLNPIHGYEGDGWPFGRPLYNEELMRLLEEIPFVDHIRDLSLYARGNARVDGDQNVLIDEASLFAVDEVNTDIRTVTTDVNGA